MAFYNTRRHEVSKYPERDVRWTEFEEKTIEGWVAEKTLFVVTLKEPDDTLPRVPAAVRLDEDRECWPEPGILPERSLRVSSFAVSAAMKGNFTQRVFYPLLVEYIATHEYKGVHFEVLAENRLLNRFYRSIASLTSHGTFRRQLSSGGDRVVHRYTAPQIDHDSA